MEFWVELISEMGYKNAMSNFHIGNRDRDKKKQVVLTSPPKSVGMHSAHRAAAIFPFPTRCLVTGPLHRASLPPRPFSRFHPSGRGRAVMSTQAMQACLARTNRATGRTRTTGKQAGGGGWDRGVIDRTKDLPFPSCLSFLL